MNKKKQKNFIHAWPLACPVGKTLSLRDLAKQSILSRNNDMVSEMVHVYCEIETNKTQVRPSPLPTCRNSLAIPNNPSQPTWLQALRHNHHRLPLRAYQNRRHRNRNPQHLTNRS